MKRTVILPLTAILMGAALLFPAVRQVRVTAQRAAVYAEPNRLSTRIDIVQRGELLNLFQQQKVKETWYYVSYVSQRYGGRMSGFIMDSAVELAEEGTPAAGKPAAPAAQTQKPRAVGEPTVPPVPQEPAAVDRAPAAKRAEPAPVVEPESPKEKPKTVDVTVVAGISRLPRAKRLSLPRRSSSPLDIPWAVSEPVAPKPEGQPVAAAAEAQAVAPETVPAEKGQVPQKAQVTPPAKPGVPREVPKIVHVLVATGVTGAPRARRLSLPRRSALPQDAPWAIIQPPAPPAMTEPVISAPDTPTAKAKKGPAKPETRVEAMPVAKKSPPAAKPAEPSSPPVEKAAPRASEPAKPKPVDLPPAKTSASPPPPAKPPRPVQTRPAGPPLARLGFGLGFGPSFGGAGGSLLFQLTRGLALHAGYGVYPTTLVYSETDWVSNESLWSVGLRVYPMPSSKSIVPYIDAQYGGFMVEAAQVITGIYNYSLVYDRQQKALRGPSLLAGLELRFGRLVLNGGIGASYSLTEWDVLVSRVFFAFEAGLGVRF